MNAPAAARDLERIRALMERAGKFSHVSGYACLTAGILALAGAGACRALGVHYNEPALAPRLAAVWIAVFALAAAQMAAFTVAKARRRGEPAWSPLTQQVVRAVLPSLLVGAVVTVHGVRAGQLDLLPPFWMLSYGMSLLALGLYAGGPFNLAGVLFILAGAATLLGWRERGLDMMAVSFGGIHLVLGGLILWKSRS